MSWTFEFFNFKRNWSVKTVLKTLKRDKKRLHMYTVIFYHFKGIKYVKHFDLQE